MTARRAPSENDTRVDVRMQHDLAAPASPSLQAFADPDESSMAESVWCLDAESEPALESARIGRFTVLQKLGSGGMGVVYSAYDDDLDRKVALKLMHPGTQASSRTGARMRREAQAMARLSHPNVVQVFEVGEYEQRLYIAMEFVPGQTLDAWLKQGLEAGSSRSKTSAPEPNPATEPDEGLLGPEEQPEAPEKPKEPTEPTEPIEIGAMSAQTQVQSGARGSSDSARGIRSWLSSTSSGRVLRAGRRGLDADGRPNHRRHSWRDVLAVHCEAGKGLAAAHRVGLVHRDYKPSNVLVSSNGRVRVLDFGLVRQEHGATVDTVSYDSESSAISTEGASASSQLPASPLQPSSTRSSSTTSSETATTASAESPKYNSLSEEITIDGAIVGTPAYMSPEQFTGAPVDSRSDQFSFCVVLYEALYGRNPYRRGSMGERLMAMMNNVAAAPPGPSDVPEWLHLIIARGLHYDPKKRWPSMEALIEALEYDPDASVDPERALRFSRRTLVAGTVAFAITAVGVWFAQEHLDISQASTSPIGALVLSVMVSCVFVVVLIVGRRTLMSTRLSRQLMGLGAVTCMGVVLTRVIPVFHEIPFEHGFLYSQLVIGCVAAAGAATVMRPLIWMAAIWLLLLPLTIWQLEHAPALQSVGLLMTCALGVRYWRRRHHD